MHQLQINMFKQVFSIRDVNSVQNSYGPLAIYFFFFLCYLPLRHETIHSKWNWIPNQKSDTLTVLYNKKKNDTSIVSTYTIQLEAAWVYKSVWMVVVHRQLYLIWCTWHKSGIGYCLLRKFTHLNREYY